MIEPKKFILHVIKTADDNPSQIVKRKSIPIKPTDNENIARMKMDVARKLAVIKESGKWTYWYLAVQITGPKNEPLFRTVVGKTFF